MFDYQGLEKFKKPVQEFFQKAGFEVGVELSKSENETINVKVKTDEPKILIGQSGQTLREIQHLLKAILKRQADQPFYINLDINNYKEKKMDYLKEEAKLLADDVVLSGKEKVLPNMSAYERRIIHLELSDRSDVRTESVGEEPERKIIIKPSK